MTEQKIPKEWTELRETLKPYVQKTADEQIKILSIQKRHTELLEKNFTKDEISIIRRYYV